MFRKTLPQKLNYATELSENLWIVCTDYQCLRLHSYVCDYYLKPRKTNRESVSGINPLKLKWKYFSNQRSPVSERALLYVMFSNLTRLSSRKNNM